MILLLLLFEVFVGGSLDWLVHLRLLVVEVHLLREVTLVRLAHHLAWILHLVVVLVVLVSLETLGRMPTTCLALVLVSPFSTL